MKFRTGLDRKDFNILKYIEYTFEKPTVRSIGEIVNMSVTGTWKRLKRLIRLGYVVRNGNGWELTDSGFREL